VEDLEHLESSSLKGVLEAMLLVSDDSVPATDFAKVLGVAPGEVASALAELSAEYADANRGLQLREVAGGWRLFTHPAYHDQVASFVLSWDTRKLSQAALETLAVVAYHQPVTREGVRAIRGVNSEGVISSLIEKGLVREMGHEADRGQAILYGTTRHFLERFGLRSCAICRPWRTSPRTRSRGASFASGFPAGRFRARSRRRRLTWTTSASFSRTIMMTPS